MSGKLLNVKRKVKRSLAGASDLLPGYKIRKG
jgi:hypothetical protein